MKVDRYASSFPALFICAFAFILLLPQATSDAMACDPVFYDGRTSTFSLDPDFIEPANCLLLLETQSTGKVVDAVRFANGCDEDVFVEIQGCHGGYGCQDTLEGGEEFTFNNPIQQKLGEPEEEARSVTSTLLWSTSSASGKMVYETTYMPPDPDASSSGRGCRPIGPPSCSTTHSPAPATTTPWFLLGLVFAVSFGAIRASSRCERA